MNLLEHAYEFYANFDGVLGLDFALLVSLLEVLPMAIGYNETSTLVKMTVIDDLILAQK
jgi:hypothetical protein